MKEGCRKRERDRERDQCENILGTKTIERALDFNNPKWKREGREIFMIPDRSCYPVSEGRKSMKVSRTRGRERNESIKNQREREK